MDNRRQMHEALAAPTIDRTKIESLRADRMKLADAASQRMTTALVDAAEVLTPAQRADLASRFQRRRGAGGAEDLEAELQKSAGKMDGGRFISIAHADENVAGERQWRLRGHLRSWWGSGRAGRRRIARSSHGRSPQGRGRSARESPLATHLRRRGHLIRAQINTDLVSPEAHAVFGQKRCPSYSLPLHLRSIRRRKIADHEQPVGLHHDAVPL